MFPRIEIEIAKKKNKMKVIFHKISKAIINKPRHTKLCYMEDLNQCVKSCSLARPFILCRQITWVPYMEIANSNGSNPFLHRMAYNLQSTSESFFFTTVWLSVTLICGG